MEETKTNHPAITKDWNPTDYDNKHSFVWKYGSEMIELLAPKDGERILDLGCGTGHLTHQISLSGAAVIGLDRSADMIEQAKAAYPEVAFVLGDGTNFEFADPFDAVFSNAALHWMPKAGDVAACISRALKPGGRFVAEFGGKGNIDTIHRAVLGVLDDLGSAAGEELHKRYFPSIGEYAQLLEYHGLQVTYALLFDRPTMLDDGENGLRHWLEMFINDVLSRLTPGERTVLIEKVESETRNALFRDGAWYADYRRLRIMAKRERIPSS